MSKVSDRYCLYGRRSDLSPHLVGTPYSLVLRHKVADLVKWPDAYSVPNFGPFQGWSVVLGRDLSLVR